MAQALEALERALASPARGREQAWRQRVRSDLAKVNERLRAHCESAEAPEGILSQLEMTVGRSYEITEARRQHRRMLEYASDLLAALSEHEGGSSPTAAEVRERAAQLTSALRRHRALEADLIYEAFDLDIGVGD